MRNFISDVNGVISLLNSKLMTNIPVEGDPLDPLYVPLTPEELIEKEIKEYINTKITQVVSIYNGSISTLGTDSPFFHRTEPRKKTYNEMYLEFDFVVDDLSLYGENYTEASRSVYTNDVVFNSSFYGFTFVEAGLLDVSTYNTSDPLFWTGMDTTAEKIIIDGLIQPTNTEATTFNSSLTTNGTTLLTIVVENGEYFARLKKFLTLDKTAKYIISLDPLGNALYVARSTVDQSKIDEIVTNSETMSKQDFSAYLQVERAALKINRL